MPVGETANGRRSMALAVPTALVLLGLIIVSYLLGQRAFFVLAFVVVSIALFELVDALHGAGRRPVTGLALAGGASMLVSAYLEKPPRYLLLALAVTTVLALLFALRPGRGPSPVTDAAWTVLGVAWIGGGGAAAVAILTLAPDPLLLIAFVLVVALADIGAYFVGTNLGKHKIAPSISPGKSWEGFAGGIVSALIGGVVVGIVLFGVSLTEGVGLGLVCGLLAPVGDLVESLVKREIGIKDSGRLLPGHGGFLDRLDAIIFCAPAAYFYLRLVFDEAAQLP